MGRAPVNIERGGLYRIAASMPNKIIGVGVQLIFLFLIIEIIGDISKIGAADALLAAISALFCTWLID
jgi:hypothetical protein